MKAEITHYLTINNKKYSYILKKINDNTTFVECKDANIYQEFLNEDIPNLLRDLPNLIISEKKYKSHNSEIIRFRISINDKKIIEKKAIKKGYATVSAYLRDLSLNDK